MRGGGSGGRPTTKMVDRANFRIGPPPREEILIT